MIKSIKIGEYEVIDNGSVLLYKHDMSAKFTLYVENGFICTIELVFKSNPEEKRTLQREVDEKNDYVKFDCINFDNAFGTGTVEPIELAVYNNRKVCMHFWSYLLGSKSDSGTRKIEYTFYIEEEK